MTTSKQIFYRIVLDATIQTAESLEEFYDNLDKGSPRVEMMEYPHPYPALPIPEVGTQVYFDGMDMACEVLPIEIEHNSKYEWSLAIELKVLRIDGVFLEKNHADLLGAAQREGWRFHT